MYVGGETENNENYKILSTTNKDEITKFINDKTSDESHHLVGSEYEKTKDSFHRIKSKKTLFMTATGKMLNL